VARVLGRRTTTKSVGLLYQLYQEDQLELSAEFQRNSVWPRAAKAYLVDTIIEDLPIPQIFLQRFTSAQTGRQSFRVIDGQQRLRAVFEYLDGRFPLSSDGVRKDRRGKRFADLSSRLQEQIRNYDFVVEELSEYSESDIVDLFVRMNKYVVRLSQQELRHARQKGAFHDFVERVGAWDIWKEQRIFTPTQLNRMRSVEFAAELTILLIEGPQDKKKSIDLYYGQYQDDFREGRQVEEQLETYLGWALDALPEFSSSRYRKPVDLYSLIGALDSLTTQRGTIRVESAEGGERLRRFERLIRRKRPPREASRYLLAASRQTDNIRPRITRISTLSDVLRAD
jgi:hypothetical protein